ncbi:MAG: AAA family ATPase [Candidatus Obscuribacterales bacterium]
MNGFYLISDNWNDWFKFSTLYALYQVDDLKVEYLGNLKIGQIGMTSGSPNLPKSFDRLDDDFFSLGQDDEYYQRIYDLGLPWRTSLLDSLNDIVAHPELLERVSDEEVVHQSLMRYVSMPTITGHFKRLSEGAAPLQRYEFKFLVGDTHVPLHFSVDPNASLPSSLHVLIGRNGVGKTRLLNWICEELVLKEDSPDFWCGSPEDFGYQIVDPVKSSFFATIVSVSFSAFDLFKPIKQVSSKGPTYYYVGLKQTKDGNRPATPEELSTAFAAGARACMKGSKRERWLRALATLESDPMFVEANIAELANDEPNDSILREKFNSLSSGHKMVLLAITKLVETVEERTLVLFDEPECHLHPPLLSSFIRAFSDLLQNRNAVGIVATHSPVVLQEVPAFCVKILRRSIDTLIVEEPTIETFGESIGVLTSEVFGLEVTYSGFHNRLREALEENATLQATIDYFEGRLGAEARAILRGMASSKDED